MPKVLISDKLSPAAVAIFRSRGIEVDMKTGLSPAELRAIIAEYDGLAIRSATKVTRELLDAAPNLKVVGRAGIGVDNVDVKSATAAGVVVMNTPYGNAITTAEHAIALMFALARQIPEASTSTKAGMWEKNRFMGVELTGKTLGLIGCGNIGSIVADRGIGLRRSPNRPATSSLARPWRKPARACASSTAPAAAWSMKPPSPTPSNPATSPARRSTSSKPSLPPNPRSSAWKTSSAPRIWVRPQPRPRKTWHSRSPNR